MPVPDDFDFETWADEARNKPVERPTTVIVTENPQEAKPAEPEPYDGIEALHALVASTTGEPVPSWVIEDRALIKFAKELWEAAYDQGAEDLAQCCGCSGGASTPNPFKEIYADDE